MLNAVKIDDLRTTYFKAVKSEQATQRLFKMCEGQTDTECIVYRGVAFTLKANYTYNPFKKLEFFNQGTELIDLALKLEPKNVEFRFLRLTVQEGSPSMLGYKDQISEDRKFVVNNISTSGLPEWYKKNVHEYLN